MRSLLFLLIALSSLAGQTLPDGLQIGVKGGVRLTSALVQYSSAADESKRYVVGPTVAIILPHGFSLELDGLYRRVGLRTGDSFPGLFSTIEGDRGNSWEFPMLLRKRLWRGWYAGGGYAPRIIRGHAHFDSFNIINFNDPNATYVYSESTGPGRWNTTHGAIVTTGWESRRGRIRWAPELRYTCWNAPAIDAQGSRGFSIQSTQNQVDVLFGISF